MDWKILLVLGFVNICYIIVGGIVFHHLEEQTEKTTRINVRNFANNFLSDFQCVNKTQFEKLLKLVLAAYDDGIVASNNVSSPSNWDYYSAVFFATTVVTTIGYGHIAPITTGGRAFCVFFALLGIPINAVFLAALGGKMNSAIRRLDHRLACKTCENRPRLSRFCRTFFIVFIGVVLFFVVPAAIFHKLEGWEYGESLYYAFISLTTIGFGDFVAGTASEYTKRGWYRICIAAWILVGLAWVALTINAMQEAIHGRTAKMEEKLNKEKGKTDGEEVATNM